MHIENARWADASRTVVVADINGARSWIPADPGNMHFAHLLALGDGAIADPEGQDEAAQEIGEAAPARTRRRSAEEA